MTGGEQNTFCVNTAAAAQGSSATTSARSSFWGLARKPAWMPAALKPAALVTPPSGSRVSPSRGTYHWFA